MLASRRPRHPVGWLLLGLGLTLSAGDVVDVYVRYGLVARPGSLPAAGYLAGVSLGTIAIWLACAGFVLLLTPTGSLPSARWRWWARVAGAAPVVYVLGSLFEPAPLRPEYPTVANPLAVVDQTMQPTTASLWLRRVPEARPGPAWPAGSTASRRSRR